MQPGQAMQDEFQAVTACTIGEARGGIPGLHTLDIRASFRVEKAFGTSTSQPCGNILLYPRYHYTRPGEML